MLAFFDPEQFKHEPKFSLFSGVPKPTNTTVPLTSNHSPKAMESSKARLGEISLLVSPLTPDVPNNLVIKESISFKAGLINKLFG